jgi:acetate kinase
MATRSGSVDPGLLLWVQCHGGIGAEEMERALDRESGLLALSGGSGDMRELISGADRGDERCRLAFDAYIHRLVAGIAAMAAAMGGIDALAFTGGVGENSPKVRQAAADACGFLGVSIDANLNLGATGDARLTQDGAVAACLVLQAREDIEIATQVRKMAGAGFEPATFGL